MLKPLLIHLAALNGNLEVVRLFMANRQKTPLHAAVIAGSFNVCKLLIEDYKDNVNVLNNYGMTPLYWACKLGLLEICKFLCKYLVDKNTLDKNRKTLLDVAVSEHKWEIISRRYL